MFTIKNTYNFVTYAPLVLGGEHKNMKLEAIMDAETAQSYRDVATTHQDVLSLLPSGTPANTNDLVFYKFRGEDGSVLVVADAWVDSSSILLVQDTIIQATIYGASTPDVQRVREALTLLNIGNFEVKTI